MYIYTQSTDYIYVYGRRHWWSAGWWMQNQRWQSTSIFFHDVSAFISQGFVCGCIWAGKPSVHPHKEAQRHRSCHVWVHLSTTWQLQVLLSRPQPAKFSSRSSLMDILCTILFNHYFFSFQFQYYPLDCIAKFMLHVGTIKPRSIQLQPRHSFLYFPDIYAWIGRYIYIWFERFA